MFKYLSIFLFSICLVLGGAIAYQNYKSNKKIIELQNQIAQDQKIIKETETAYSQLAIKTSEIELQNKELQKVIERKDEEIFANAQIALQWKDKFLKLYASQTVIDNNGNTIPNTTPIPEDCKSLRYRVDFNKEQDNIRVEGFTLTNPPEAEMKLQFTKPLILSLVLTKKDNQYKVYVDPNDPTIMPTEIKLSVNPELFSIKWYQRFLAEADIGISFNGEIIPSAKIMYFFNLKDNLLLSPYAGGIYSHKAEKAVPVIGLQLSWAFFK